MSVYVYTLGCRLNQCESESLVQKFLNAGFNITDSYKEADLVVVNTCTVTSKAEQKCRREIRLFSKYASVIVIGCYARLNAKEIEDLAENVYVWPFTEKSKNSALLESVKDVFLTSVSNNKVTSLESNINASGTKFSSHVRAYLKIQDGCNNECGYCRVRVARGKSVSVPINTLIETALKIQDNGYKEIVLTGVNLMQYRSSANALESSVSEFDFSDLIERLLKTLNSDVYIRFSSLEPELHKEKFYEVISDKRVQPYFHLPVQSGSLNVLKRVNRKIYPENIEKMIYKLRSVKEDPFISADFITGLPSEDEREFEETVNFIKRNDFSALHVFPFSPRPDTILYLAKDRVPESVRDERAQVLRELSINLNTKYKERQIGKKFKAIIEGKKGSYYNAITGNYIKLVFKTDLTLSLGSLVDVLIDKMDSNGDVYGNYI